MALQIQDSRILIKRTTGTTVVPSVAPSNDHTDGTWDVEDIYVGEIYANVEDNRLWIRYTDGIEELVSVPLAQANGFNFANATGTNAYVASLTPNLTEYTAGNVFLMTFANANTGAATLQVDLLAAKDIKKNNATLIAGDIAGSVPYLLGYNGTFFTLLGAGGSGSVNSGTQYRLAYYATTGTALSETSAISGNKALISDANGVPTHSSVTNTELGYVSGVTSAIQTQFGQKLSLTGGSMSGAINENVSIDIASAGTTDIGAATGNYVNVTGTTTITALGTVQSGTRRIVTFTGSLTLTHHGTSLILPTGANITTAAGDSAEFISLGSGNWKCVQYTSVSNNNTYDVVSDSNTTYTLANSDFPIRNIRLLRQSNASAITTTIPNDSTLTNVPIGSTIVFSQTGVGQITLTAGASVTFIGADSAYTSRTQYSVISATKVAASTWIIYGDVL